ncbi:MAG: hypothetical protein RLZZ383_1726 [Pseudomonadota bacterium]
MRDAIDRSMGLDGTAEGGLWAASASGRPPARPGAPRPLPGGRPTAGTVRRPTASLPPTSRPPPPPSRSSGGSGGGWAWRFGAWTTAAAAIAGVLAGAVYWFEIVRHPGPEFTRRAILNVIADESPVYFNDGETRLGAFFEDEHRQQVEWEDLPPAWTAAIVAAEDERFWSHAGFDPLGIARAMKDNLLAGRLVAGGSTLTQQTAKNLFYRPDRSLGAKLDEALAALRLEQHFTKADLLTFYANQFHVAGNGRGLGIAARHFFNKPLGELTTVEAAFLAGMVKAPAAYDPFSSDPAKAEAVRKRAHDRTVYVLRRLSEAPLARLIGDARRAPEGATAAWAQRDAAIRAAVSDAQKALAEGFTLEFSKGTFRYDSSAVLDEVRRRLAERPFVDILRAAGVEDPAKAGLKVITTLDAEVQRAAVYGMWHHLTELGTMIEGRKAADFVLADARPPRVDPGEPLVPTEFRTAKVVGPEGAKGKVTLALDLGGVGCTVDRAGLGRVANAIERGRSKNSGATASAGAVDRLASELPKDAIVYVSVREATQGKSATCDLELRPEVQGAAMVVQNGEIRAMVAGNDNKNFNRATALRQFGSTWKSLVLQAALELGWSPTDMVPNAPTTFSFGGTSWSPTKGHASADQVSVAWAGIQSENIASVALMTHLLDKLSMDQILTVARRVGLDREANESAGAYRRRLGEAGLVLGSGAVEAPLVARARAVADAAHPGLDGVATIAAGGLAAWPTLRDRREACLAALQDARAAWAAAAPGPTSLVVRSAADGALTVWCGEGGEGWTSLAAHPVGEGALPDDGALWLAPGVSVAAVDAFGEGLARAEEERAQGLLSTDPLDPVNLTSFRDFRTLVSMRYLRKLAARYGVQTPVKEVLSLPLGAVEITLEEAVKMYEGILTGMVWSYPGEAAGAGARVAAQPFPALLIREIQTVEGRVLYRAKPEAAASGAPESHAMTADILRNVVELGTGKRAKGAVKALGQPVPFGGKTGTTNDARNVAFLGFLPQVTRAETTMDGAWTLGVYVGYDDNRPLKLGNSALSGATGALPAWTTMAQRIAQLPVYAYGRPPADGWYALGGPALEPSGVPESPDATVLVRMRALQLAVDPALEDADAVADDVPVAPSTTTFELPAAPSASAGSASPNEAPPAAPSAPDGPSTPPSPDAPATAVAPAPAEPPVVGIDATPGPAHLDDPPEPDKAPAPEGDVEAP